MGLIRIVRGTARAPTALSSYDAALAAANVHNYNLVEVSSVLPAGARVERVGRAPDLGPVGERLTVVQARSTVEAGRAVAGLGWTTAADGRGLFYEASGREERAVREEIEAGLAAGRALRDWSFEDEGYEFAASESADSSESTDTGESTDASESTYATAVVLAVYGESAPLL
jgi:arginine decarboxylase